MSFAIFSIKIGKWDIYLHGFYRVRMFLHILMCKFYVYFTSYCVMENCLLINFNQFPSVCFRTSLIDKNAKNLFTNNKIARHWIYALICSLFIGFLLFICLFTLKALWNAVNPLRRAKQTDCTFFPITKDSRKYAFIRNDLFILQKWLQRIECQTFYGLCAKRTRFVMTKKICHAHVWSSEK